MPTVFDKLNLKDHQEILVINAPDSFERELGRLRHVTVLRHITEIKSVAFALAFVIERAELDRVSKTLAAKAIGDALLWFAYPKATSKKYTCEFNRDDGWHVLRGAGFDSVRQVAIDDDWTAVRFRRVERIRRPTR